MSAPTASRSRSPGVLATAWLGRVPYAAAWASQETLHSLRQELAIPDTLLLLEHDPVYTAGRNADERHLLMDPAERARRGIEFVRTTRGGDMTYHGPGQLVGYPIVHLARRGLGVIRYVDSLEHALLSVVRGYGVEAAVDRHHRGVWAGNCKIAAIGVRISRGVSLHGFSLNVAPDLSGFAGIVPCGIHGRGVTSLAALGVQATLADVVTRVIGALAHELAYDSSRAVCVQAPAELAEALKAFQTTEAGA